MKLIIFLIALLCCCELRAGTIRADVDPQAYLNLADQTKYDSVGRLSTQRSNGSITSSATLIAPDVLLTAGHAVAQATGISFYVDNIKYTASQWSAYPLWSGDLAAGYDIGLVKLNAPVLGITPAVRYDGSKEVGLTSTFVGYGMTGTGLTGANSYDGQKRAGTNVIDSVSAGKGSSARILWTDFDQPTASQRTRVTSSGVTALEYMIARGDSGGGLFVDTKSGTQLVGVASFGYSLDGNVDASYGEKAGFTRVSAFDSWIDAMLRQFAGTTMQSVTTPRRPGLRANELEIANVPEPSSFVLMVIGLCAILRRRKR